MFFIPFKVAGTTASRDVVVLAVMAIAAVLNTATAAGRRPAKPAFDRVALITASVLGALTVTGNVAASHALRYVGAGSVTVLLQTQIFFVAVGMVVVLLGLVLMRIPSSGGEALHWAGLVLGLVAAVAFAAMHVVTRKVIDRIQPVPVNALRLWLAAGLLLCLPGNAGELVRLSGTTWLLCAAAAFAGPFFSRICIMYAVRYIPASQSVLITLIVPVLAFAFDFAILGTRPSAFELLGGVVVIAGVALPVLELAGRSGDSTPTR